MESNSGEYFAMAVWNAVIFSNQNPFKSVADFALTPIGVATPTMAHQKITKPAITSWAPI